jgi:hypothetical protein
VRPVAHAIALLVAGLLAASCGKSDDGERKEAKETAPRSAPPAEPAAEVPPEAPDPGAAAPAPPTSEEQATADKAAAVLESLGKIAEEAKGNCDKAATAMKAVIDKNKAVLSAAEKLGQDEGKEKWLAEMYGPRTDAAKSKLMPLMEKCADHDGIATVFDSIE